MELVSILVALAALTWPAAQAHPFPDATASSSAAGPLSTSSGAADSQEHIVLLDSSSPDPNDVLNRIGLDQSHADVKYVFNNSVFQGFVATVPSHSVAALNNMSDVSQIEQAVSVSSLQLSVPDVASALSSVADPAETRSNTPWGLQRISSAATVAGNPSAMTYTFSYPDNSPLGTGVDIYIVDSGINTANAAFGGRARMGFSYENDTSDGDGHGTHVAGTAGSIPFGIASGAALIGVKVLNANGSGSSSDTIAGMNYVISQHDARRGQPGFVGSIMSMSWGLETSSSVINQAVLAASSAGVQVSLAAGNDAADACNYSPSQVGGANSDGVVSVGSVGQTNAISSFSNRGACIDVFAPGENVLSAWKGGATMVNTLSGTSMSTPHVTGVMALMMSQTPALAQDPKALKTALLAAALKGQVGGSNPGGQSLLLNDGVTDGTGTLGILRRARERGQETSSACPAPPDGVCFPSVSARGRPAPGSPDGWTMVAGSGGIRW